MPSVSVTEFTDPACPFAFSAEPHRLRLKWLFGEQLDWREHMVVLSETRQANRDKGFTPEKLAEGAGAFAEKFGMPMSEEPKADVSASLPACRAVVAARLHAPGKEGPLLRRLRHLNFAGPLLDDPATIAQAATDVGLDPVELEAWMAEEETERVLREDMQLARDPTPAALALKQKLAETPEGGWRYTCPSLEFAGGDGVSLSVPGMQSTLNYETALANVEPGLERRAEPEDVSEVLAWAGYPLATQEVAEVCGLSRDDAREQLTAAGAQEEQVGRDGFWTLAV